jgi:hypothetical protein
MAVLLQEGLGRGAWYVGRADLMEARETSRSPDGRPTVVERPNFK